MIDFHTHILHDIDDGPRTLEDSLAMAQAAYEDGTRIVVATPHAPGWNNTYTAERVLDRLAALYEAMAAAQLPLEVVPGGELFYDADLPTRLKAGEFLTCNQSRTVLVECPIYEKMPVGLPQLVFQLQLAGYRIVLAHPERINDVIQDPNTLIPLIERGVLMQLTTQALIGEQGTRAKELAETLVTHNLVHIIASDAHSLPRRPPLLSAARARAAELVGDEAATAMVQDTPHALLHDQPVKLPDPQAVKAQKRRWW